MQWERRGLYSPAWPSDLLQSEGAKEKENWKVTFVSQLSNPPFLHHPHSQRHSSLGVIHGQPGTKTGQEVIVLGWRELTKLCLKSLCKQNREKHQPSYVKIKEPWCAKSFCMCLAFLG